MIQLVFSDQISLFFHASLTEKIQGKICWLGNIDQRQDLSTRRTICSQKNVMVYLSKVTRIYISVPQKHLIPQKSS